MAARLNTPTPPPPCRPRVSRFSETLSESGFGLCGEEVSVSKRDGSRFGMAAAEGFDSTPSLLYLPPVSSPSRLLPHSSPVALVALLQADQSLPPERPPAHPPAISPSRLNFSRVEILFCRKDFGSPENRKNCCRITWEELRVEISQRESEFSGAPGAQFKRTRLERRADGRGFDFSPRRSVSNREHRLQDGRLFRPAAVAAEREDSKPTTSNHRLFRGTRTSRSSRCPF